MCASLAKIPGSTIKRSPFFFSSGGLGSPFPPSLGRREGGGTIVPSLLFSSAPLRDTLSFAAREEEKKSQHKNSVGSFFWSKKRQRRIHPKKGSCSQGITYNIQPLADPPCPTFLGGRRWFGRKEGEFLGGCHPPTLLTRRPVPGNMRMNA